MEAKEAKVDILVVKIVEVLPLQDTHYTATPSKHLDDTTQVLWRQFCFLFFDVGVCDHHIRPLGGAELVCMFSVSEVHS